MSIFSARGKEQILPFQLSSSETHLHGWGQMLIAKFEFLRPTSQVLTKTFVKLTIIVVEFSLNYSLFDCHQFSFAPLLDNFKISIAKF